MYYYRTGIGPIDQVFSGFEQGTTIIILIHICRGLCMFHRFFGKRGVKQC